MDLSWSAADTRFREEVRDFIAAELTPDLRKAGRSMTSVYADYDVGMKWQRILLKRGWGCAGMASRIWRLRLERGATLHLCQRDGFCGRPAAFADGDRHVRASSDRTRHGGTEGPLPAAHARRERISGARVIRSLDRVRISPRCR